MDNWLQILFVLLVGIIVISLFTKEKALHRGGGWCDLEDGYTCGWEDEDKEVNRAWRRLPPRLKRLIKRLFKVRLTGVDVKRKVTNSLKISEGASDRRLAYAFAEYLNANLGKGKRVDWVINSEWRRLPPQTRRVIVQLFRLRWGNGVKIAQQMVRKLKLNDPETDVYDLGQKLLRRR